MMTQSIDLTHTFSENTPVYPGDPPTELHQIAEFHSDGYSDFKLETTMHVGTHIDAPMHMTADGCYVSEINVNSLSANGYLIDARNHNLLPPQLINLNKIQPGDIVLVYTGFGSKFHHPNYFKDYPEFSEKFARLLVEANVSMVGMDTPSPDRSPYMIHKLLLSENILIIENLTNLDKLLGVAQFRVYAFPLKLISDASPARVIAEVQE
jgi:kynurenine formamidase